jgi:hypothetical protein
MRTLLLDFLHLSSDFHRHTHYLDRLVGMRPGTGGAASPASRHPSHFLAPLMPSSPAFDRTTSSESPKVTLIRRTSGVRGCPRIRAFKNAIQRTSHPPRIPKTQGTFPLPLRKPQADGKQLRTSAVCKNAKNRIFTEQSHPKNVWGIGEPKTGVAMLVSHPQSVHRAPPRARLALSPLTWLLACTKCNVLPIPFGLSLAVMVKE